jgi:Cu2+-exporting ATPase
MLITLVVSTAGTFEPDGIFGAEVYFDSLTMFVFFLLTGRWLELRLRDRTAGALEALMNRLPDSVERQRADGDFERVAVRRLGPGDVIRVLPGEAFPADGAVLQGETLADESLLTGESRPVPRGPGDAVIAGSHNLASVVRVRVERTGGQTRFAQIVALMDLASTTKPQIAQLADRLAKPFLIAVLVAAGGACAFWWSRDPGHALMVAVAVLVVTCPCALSLATPAAMLASAGALARRGVLVRRLQALETLATVDTVVFDKTGTLTRDAFALGTVTTRTGVSAEQALGRAAALARQSLHPASRALVAAATGSGLPEFQASAVREVAGQGVSGQVVMGGARFAGGKPCAWVRRRFAAWPSRVRRPCRCVWPMHQAGWPRSSCVKTCGATFVPRCRRCAPAALPCTCCRATAQPPWRAWRARWASRRRRETARRRTSWLFCARRSSRAARWPWWVTA